MPLRPYESVIFKFPEVVNKKVKKKEPKAETKAQAKNETIESEKAKENQVLNLSRHRRNIQRKCLEETEKNRKQKQQKENKLTKGSLNCPFSAIKR